MMHPETLEVYDRKERTIGIIRKRETLSVSFVRESIGETHAKSLTQKKQEDRSSKKRNCVSTVAAQDTGVTMSKPRMFQVQVKASYKSL